MQFIDLAAQQQRIREKIQSNISEVLNHGKYIMGPEVEKLEKQLAEYVNISHAVGCGSGTDALLMAMLAYGIGPGDAVFTTPFTFIATSEVVRLLGATPVFVDIDPVTFNISPDQLEKAVEALKNHQPDQYPLPNKGMSCLVSKGIIAVDLFGLPADYEQINAIAKTHNLFVVEDAAQSLGGEYKNKKACALAQTACTSFFPAKPLGCYGDGGAVFTHDDKLADKLKSIRIHGKGTDKYDNMRVGINGRLDAIQAAVLLAKMEIFTEEVELRQKAAQRYTDGLASCKNIITPSVPEGFKSVWAQYSLLAESADHRAEIQARLKTENIPTAIYYPKPLHMQTAFEDLGYAPDDFPVSYDYSQRIFSLPMHPYLKEEDQNKIIKILTA